MLTVYQQLAEQSITFSLITFQHHPQEIFTQQLPKAVIFTFKIISHGADTHFFYLEHFYISKPFFKPFA